MNTTWKTVRVFISSTFRDMQAERDWLVRFIFPRLREELLKYRIHFVDVDLRWGVTSDQNALGVCREVIDECHPRFLCMLGGRYGWVPEGQDKSITADEIYYGVLGREAEKRGHAFFYFRDDSATARMVEETLGDFREPEASDRSQKLAALKQAIADAGLPVFIYDAQWDTAQKRLAKLDAFGNRVQTDLLQSLKDDRELAARFTTESTATPDEFAEEVEQMDAFIEERTERFLIGSREPLMRDMLAFAADDGAPNIFVLTGEPGSGKSAILAKFTRELAAGHPSSLILPHFVGASVGSTDLRRTLRRLCHELARAVGNTEPLPLDIKELITHFQKLLAEAAGRQRIILVLDALNQFDATDGAHWLNWLPRELPSGVRIVASVIAPADGQPEHQTLAILRTRPSTRLEKLEPLTEADTLAVIESCLRRYAKRLSPEQLAALLAKPSGRLPLYVLTALEELRTLGTYEEIADRIRTLPGDARSLFGWILTERLARDPGFRDREGRQCGAALVEKFATCLGASRHGLSSAELTALLDPGDPLGNVAAFLRLLGPYLMRRGELLDFYHSQFREAVLTGWLERVEKVQIAHRTLAIYFSSIGFALIRERGLTELPHHLFGAQEYSWLRQFLRRREIVGHWPPLPEKILSWAHIAFGRTPAPSGPGIWFNIGIVPDNVPILRNEIVLCNECDFQGGYDLAASPNEGGIPGKCPNCGHTNDQGLLVLFRKIQDAPLLELDEGQLLSRIAMDLQARARPIFEALAELAASKRETELREGTRRAEHLERQKSVERSRQLVEQAYRQAMTTGVEPLSPNGIWYEVYEQCRYGHSLFCRRCGGFEEDEGPPPEQCPHCGWAGT